MSASTATATASGVIPKIAVGIISACIDSAFELRSTAKPRPPNFNIESVEETLKRVESYSTPYEAISSLGIKKTPQERWRQIFEAAREQEKECPECKGAESFALAWHDLIHLKQGRSLKELDNPDNFKKWLSTVKSIEVKEDGSVVLPDVLKQAGECDTCGDRKERVLRMLKDLEERARVTREKILSGEKIPPSPSLQ
jgi:hypothetical protein